MRRIVAVLVPVLLLAGTVLSGSPASSAQAPSTSSGPGWTVTGDVIGWTAPRSLALTDAVVEFWDGSRLLGRARESVDLRTFTLRARGVKSGCASGALGSPVGGLMIVNDDSLPTLEVEPVADRVTEGAALTWRGVLSEPIGSPFTVRGHSVAGAGELSSTDVDPEWFRVGSSQDPLPSRPLSSTEPAVWEYVEKGVRTMEIRVPTVVDGETGPEERIRLRFQVLSPGGVEEFEVTGAVTTRPEFVGAPPRVVVAYERQASRFWRSPRLCASMLLESCEVRRCDGGSAAVRAT